MFFRFCPPSQEGGHQCQGHPPAPGTLHELVGEGVIHGSVIRHARDNLSSATKRSAIGDRYQAHYVCSSVRNVIFCTYLFQNSLLHNAVFIMLIFNFVW